MVKTRPLTFKEKVHEVIFEADTRQGKWFDIVLIVAIVLSVLIVMLETVPSLEDRFGHVFYILEWIFTILFTIEYALRLYSVKKPMKYATSFYGVVDLISILPTYLSFFIYGSQSLMVIRALRLLRIFRVFKLANHFKQGLMLIRALRDSAAKISVFLFFIILMTIMFGSLMYLIEAKSNAGFDSIPRSIYWAIVTLTTVGYGDISPSTNLGQFIAAIVMILGYAVIAVPTGVVTSEIIRGTKKNQNEVNINTQSCQSCSREGHDDDAIYCKYCGEKINEQDEED